VIEKSRHHLSRDLRGSDMLGGPFGVARGLVGGWAAVVMAVSGGETVWGREFVEFLFKFCV